MTFKEAYKTIKKDPYCRFLHTCDDWGDLWGFGFTSEFYPQGAKIGGGPCFINKKTGEEPSSVSVFTDPNRTKGPTPIPVPRFAAEGWDYYDEKTDTFKLKSDAPHWAKLEFEAFYGTDESEHEDLPQPARLAYA
jgi:hypothetical protein